jgi:hypothetical protein
MESRSLFSHGFKGLAAAMLGLAPLLSASPLASAAEIRCDQCSEAAFQTMASQAGVGIHYVYDLRTAQSRKYAVERSCEGPHDCSMEVSSLPVEADVNYIVMELTAYGQATEGSMSSNFTVYTNSDLGGMTAFDVAGPGGPRTQLLNWLSSSQSMTLRNALPGEGAVLHNMIVTALNIFKNNIGKTLVTVEFTDQSRVITEFESINGTFIVVEGSATDRYGNVIPATPEQLNGTRFDYSREGPDGPAQQRMRNYLTIYGARVTNGTKWSCVRISEGAWHCAAY